MKHLTYVSKRKIWNWVDTFFFCKNWKILVLCWKHFFTHVQLFLAMTCRHGSEVTKKQTARIQKFLVTFHCGIRMQLSGISYWINCSNKPKMWYHQVQLLTDRIRWMLYKKKCNSHIFEYTYKITSIYALNGIDAETLILPLPPPPTHCNKKNKSQDEY